MLSGARSPRVATSRRVQVVPPSWEMATWSDHGGPPVTALSARTNGMYTLWVGGRVPVPSVSAAGGPETHSFGSEGSGQGVGGGARGGGPVGVPGLRVSVLHGESVAKLPAAAP